MQAIYEINRDIVYVEGAARGAIYNFLSGKVYSINQEACSIIKAFIQEQKNNPFLDELKNSGLIGVNFFPREYVFPQIGNEINFVWLELTEACNLRCLHCYEGDEHKDILKERLTFNQWLNILDQLKELGCKNVEFIGGEPTVYPYFFELLEYACSIGLNVDVYSNLLLFTDEIADFIKHNKIRVHFSLYGSNSGIHDSITGKKGSFEKTLYWVRKLNEKGVVIIPAISILRHNQDDYDNMIDLMKSIGLLLDLLSVDVVRSTAKRCAEDLRPNDSAMRLACKTKPDFHAIKSFFNKANCTNTCLFGKFSIQPNGDVSPCEFCRDIVCGNAKEQLISDILQSKQLKKLWFFDFSKIEKCNCCEYRFACKDCRMAADVHNGINKKNPRCFYDPEKGVWKESL